MRRATRSSRCCSRPRSRRAADAPSTTAPTRARSSTSARRALRRAPLRGHLQPRRWGSGSTRRTHEVWVADTKNNLIGVFTPGRRAALHVRQRPARSSRSASRPTRAAASYVLDSDRTKIKVFSYRGDPSATCRSRASATTRSSARSPSTPTGTSTSARTTAARSSCTARNSSRASASGPAARRGPVPGDHRDRDRQGPHRRHRRARSSRSRSSTSTATSSAAGATTTWASRTSHCRRRSRSTRRGTSSSSTRCATRSSSSISTATSSTRFGGLGPACGQEGYPSGIVIDPSDRLYVVERGESARPGLRRSGGRLSARHPGLEQKQRPEGPAPRMERRCPGFHLPLDPTPAFLLVHHSNRLEETDESQSSSFVLAILIAAAFPVIAGEWHAGGTNVCTDCHTMHFSMQHNWENGNAPSVNARRQRRLAQHQRTQPVPAQGPGQPALRRLPRRPDLRARRHRSQHEHHGPDPGPFRGSAQRPGQRRALRPVQGTYARQHQRSARLQPHGGRRPGLVAV